MPDTPGTVQTGCGVCSAPTGDHGYLCRTHTLNLEADLRDVPSLYGELDVTITRQDRLQADKHGGRSATKPLPFNVHAAECGIDLNLTLNAWSRDVSLLAEDERDQLIHCHHTDTVAVALWLARNLHTLRQHPEAGTAHDELTHAIREIRRAIDRPLDKIFAGPCNAEDDDGHVCTEDLYGTPGKKHATCRACGADHDMAERREWMLSCIEDQVAHSGLLSGLVTNLGVPIASSTIRRYASLGRIKVISVDAKRRPLYRIGDVLDVFMKRAA